MPTHRRLPLPDPCAYGGSGASLGSTNDPWASCVGAIWSPLIVLSFGIQLSGGERAPT